MNYRSVVVLGTATLVDDPDEKIEACSSFRTHHSWTLGRVPSQTSVELKATSVLRVPIDEFSAKVRTGPVIDDEEDYSFPTWAGILPLEMKRACPSPIRALILRGKFRRTRNITRESDSSPFRLLILPLRVTTSAMVAVRNMNTVNLLDLTE